MKCVILDNNVYFSRHDLIDCETDSEYIDCYNILTGSLQYRFNSGDFNIKDNKFYFYRSHCPYKESIDEDTFFKKELPAFNTIKSIKFENGFFSNSEYGTKYIVIETYIEKTQKLGNKIDIYDYDLNHIQTIAHSFGTPDRFFSSKVYDDVMILSIAPTKDSNDSELIVYGLPDYKKSNHSYKPPYNLIFWILKYILGRVAGLLP